MGMNVKKEVVAFVAIVFLLLGALFGVQIMTFIFANLGPAEAGLTAGTTAFNVSTAIQNNSLGSLETYSEQADTQMNTAAITITLLILIALFAIFWKLFVKSRGKEGSSFG